MRPPSSPSSPDYRSPPWVQALGNLIERVGLWPAIALCTLLSQALTMLSIPLISLFLMPGSLERAMIIGFLVPLITTPSISFAVFRLIEDLNLTRKALRQIANQDGLTQAHTGRFFMDAISAPLPATLIRSVPDSIVLLDIDDFKQINDRHGHLFGDTVLQAVSDACRGQLRSDDLFARFGGEEFVILLADAGPELARAVAERIRRAIADMEIRDLSGARIHVTASLGIAHRGDRVRGAGAALLEQALGLADQALYLAKRNGKNRFEFVTFSDLTPAPA
jgi:diguanylate cyclase (GGDEF)-like protein